MQGANTIPPRGRLNALLAAVAVLVIAAFMTLVVWAGPLGFSGIQTKETVQAAGAATAVVHDDAGSVHGGLARGYAVVHDDAGNVGTGLSPGYAPVRHDVGTWRPTARTAVVHDDAGNVNP
jgi:hypothetical protein